MSERRTTPEDITGAVVASFDGCEDDRLRELMQALARHLHGFATEVRLTHSGWEALGDVAAAEARRRDYDNGWASVFEDCFRRYADGAG